MVNISNIPRIHGQKFETDVRIVNPVWRTSAQGNKYLSCHLADSSGCLPAYLWLHSEDLETIFVHGQLMKVSGYGKQLDFQFHLVIENIQNAEKLESSITTLSNHLCQSKDDLQELQEHINAIDIPELRNFIYGLFSDQEVAISYLNVPASFEHHHSHVGGLLKHCNEVARYCRNQASTLTTLELSLLITAALTHDIGKIRSHGKTHRYGWIVHHDSLALEITAKPLKQLDKSYPDAGLALRYLLTRKNSSTKNSLSVMPITEILESADRFSAARDVEGEVFSKSYPGASYAKWSGYGPVNRFWRPTEPIISNPILRVINYETNHHGYGA